MSPNATLLKSFVLRPQFQSFGHICSSSLFDKNYELLLKHLKFKGLQPKTIAEYSYSRAIRRTGDYFDHQIDDLTEADLLDYFTDLRETHSWRSVKLDLHELKFSAGATDDRDHHDAGRQRTRQADCARVFRDAQFVSAGQSAMSALAFTR